MSYNGKLSTAPMHTQIFFIHFSVWPIMCGSWVCELTCTFCDASRSSCLWSFSIELKNMFSKQSISAFELSFCVCTSVDLHEFCVLTATCVSSFKAHVYKHQLRDAALHCIFAKNKIKIIIIKNKKEQRKEERTLWFCFDSLLIYHINYSDLLSPLLFLPFAVSVVVQ